MLKVNFTLWGTGLCGGVRAVFEVANRLSDRGYNVQITSLMRDEQWFPLKVPVVYIEPPKILKFIKPYVNFKSGRQVDYRDVENILKKLKLNFGVDLVKLLAEASPKCDINIATHYLTSLPVWFSGKGTPFFFMQDFWEQIGSVYGRRFFQAALKLPFCFLTNSNYTKELVLEQQPAASIYVANVGVDRTVFYHRESHIKSDVKRPIVMAIIRGDWFKKDDMVVRLLNSVNREVPIHAFLVGSSEALKIIRQNANIEFPYSHFESACVNDDKMAILYSSADLFLFTSEVEGFGLPPLEAMACGTSVVTTDCKGNKDYALDNFNCLMAKPNDIIGLRRIMIRILEDRALKERLIDGGLNTAKKFTWDRTTEIFEMAFTEYARKHDHSVPDF